MAATDYESELRRAGATATRSWRKLAFLARRLPLVLVPRIVRFINKTRGVSK